jgi:hypothetical protein
VSTSAIRSEATGSSVEVEFDGVTYAIPTPEEWSIDVLEAFEEGKVTAVVKAMIGEDQYASWKSGKSRKVSDLTEFFEVIQKALGLGN